ncbi:hypothetical protein BgiMline_011564, partial [Biomphalaria glabrata]
MVAMAGESVLETRVEPSEEERVQVKCRDRNKRVAVDFNWKGGGEVVCLSGVGGIEGGSQ